MSKLAQLIGKEEGFGVPGAIPTRDNNPGDLEHAPGELHTTASPVGSFVSPEEGWYALERQLQLYGERGMTLREAVYAFAPPSENDTARYLEFICAGLGCQPDIPVTEALKII